MVREDGGGGGGRNFPGGDTDHICLLLTSWLNTIDFMDIFHIYNVFGSRNP